MAVDALSSASEGFERSRTKECDRGCLRDRERISSSLRAFPRVPDINSSQREEEAQGKVNTTCKARHRRVETGKTESRLFRERKFCNRSRRSLSSRRQRESKFTLDKKLRAGRPTATGLSVGFVLESLTKIRIVHETGCTENCDKGIVRRPRPDMRLPRWLQNKEAEGKKKGKEGNVYLARLLG